MKIRKLLASLVLCPMFFLSTLTTAHAALIDNGVTTLDTSSSLEWLDLTQTTGFSVAGILQGDGGFAADGWAHATGQEMSNLITSFLGSASTPNFDVSGNASSFDILADTDAVELASLLGLTFNTGLAGFFDNGSLSNTSSQLLACINTLATAICQNPATQSSQAGLVKHFFNVTDANQFASPAFGHFLARKADVQVNSPATLTIFVIIFIGLTLRKFTQKS
jgi:hypothetical protein